MKRLQKHANILKVLAKAKPSLQKAIISAGDKGLVDTLCDCAQNILRGNVPLTSRQKNCLRRHKHLLRSLTERQSVQKKKQILQRGGFLAGLLAPVLGILGSVLGAGQ